MNIVSNDLKKGDVVKLKNGWYAVIADNMKGNTRMATVHGYSTETGSVYSHDIQHRLVKAEKGEDAIPGEQYQVVMGARGPLTPGLWRVDEVQPTPAQQKLAKQVRAFA